MATHSSILAWRIPWTRGDWWAIVHRVAKSRTQLSNYTFLSFFHPLHRMSLRDFKAHFMLLVICKLSPGLLTQEVGQKWSYTMLEGRWENGSTAGGQMKSPRGESVYGSQRLSRLGKGGAVGRAVARGTWLRR